MNIKDGLLGKVPFVTIVVAVVMTLVFVTSMWDGGAGGEFEERLLRAQVFFEQNPGISIEARDRKLLGEEFVERVLGDHEASLEVPVFSKRMRDRTQAKFDSLCAAAVKTRLAEDPVWSQGISGPDVPPTRYLTYAFFHDGWLAFGVTLAFLLVAGLLLEASWGALIHAPLVLVSILLGGAVYAYLDADGQTPLVGGGPLLAALLAAYLVRGFGGRLRLPGVILLPAWLFIDTLFVRGIWIENLGDWPAATLGVSMVLGAAVGGAVRIFGVDSKLVDSVDGLVDGIHPALEAADRSKALGRPADAFDTLAAAARDESSNAALVLAWWEVAIEIGRADEVAHAVLPILQSELRTGDIEAATTHWRQVMASGAAVKASTTLLVRMGEALLDAGEPEQALDTLRRALDAPGPMGSALAQRVVRIARDLDPVLTARAAEVALADTQIDADTRADLELLAGSGSSSSATWSDARRRAGSPGAGARADALDAGVASTPRRAPAGPDEDIDAGLGEPAPMAGGGHDDFDTSDIDLSHVGDLAAADDFDDLSSGAEGLPPMGLDAASSGGPDPIETDPNALSLQSIEREFASGLEAEAQPATRADDPNSWNDVGRIEDLSGELEAGAPALIGLDDLDEPMFDNSFLDAGALSLDALSGEAASDPPARSSSFGDDFTSDVTDPMAMVDDLDDSTDALPPLSAEATGGFPPLSSKTARAAVAASKPAPLAAPPVAAKPAPLAAPPVAAKPARLAAPPVAAKPAPLAAPPMAAQPAPLAAPPVAAKPAPLAAPPRVAPASPQPIVSAVDEGRAVTRVVDIAAPGTCGASLRALKVLDAVPLALEADALKFDVEGRGKTRLPFARIDAVAVAAVSGLSAKPVLVIDFVLNWSSGAGESLKVIRVRSDGFNPVTLVGGGGAPLEAIKTLIRRVLDATGATPLPDVGAVVGSPFAVLPDLSAYEREVLQAG